MKMSLSGVKGFKVPYMVNFIQQKSNSFQKEVLWFSIYS